ncbi:growth hormone receptor-like [Scleropages formosus]|uniref:Growth hormone receptor-like n=1 Tax=Scleropages formosus TaxID=113540 RepID=A0A8C9QPQ4_SCLFO|nr:growth hormone receptor-like [Scleropages formosus]
MMLPPPLPPLLLLLLGVGMGFAPEADHPRQDHQPPRTSEPKADADSASLEAHIYYCRSPNMETFTCWWRFHGNASQSDHNITVSLTYTVGKGPRQECPDYVSGGPDSCYFDSRHTRVWEMYCMSVTARGASGLRTSQELCADVADIVETDPPFDLTYRPSNSSADEAGRTTVISWQYPIAADVQMGWVTLVYELQYRRESEPRDWKVKGMLREPRLELPELPAGRYVVRVRCKSHNSELWSKWSESLTVDIPARQTAVVSPDKSVALALLMSFGSVAILLIGFGVVPQGKRIKAFLLPPVPRPRIRGIDPVVLKRGRVDEINQLFLSLHGYSSPQCAEDPWLHVTLDERFSLKESHTTVNTSGHVPFEGQQALPPVEDPTPYCQGPGPYWEGMPQSQETLNIGGPGCAPQTLTFPSTPHVVQGYTTAMNPALVPAACQDFYTCVAEVSSQGAVLLCPPDYLTEVFYLQLRDPAQPVKKGAQVDMERGGVHWSGAAYTSLENLSPESTGYVGVAPNHIGWHEGGAFVQAGRDVGVASTHGGLDVGGASARDAQKYTVAECLCPEKNELSAPLLPAAMERM